MKSATKTARQIERARQTLIAEIEIKCWTISNRMIDQYRRELKTWREECRRIELSSNKQFAPLAYLVFPEAPKWHGILTPPADLKDLPLSELAEFAAWLHIESGEMELVVETETDFYYIPTGSAWASGYIMIVALGESVIGYLEDALRVQAVSDLIADLFPSEEALC